MEQGLLWSSPAPRAAGDRGDSSNDRQGGGEMEEKGLTMEMKEMRVELVIDLQTLKTSLLLLLLQPGLQRMQMCHCNPSGSTTNRLSVTFGGCFCTRTPGGRVERSSGSGSKELGMLFGGK